MIRKEHWGDISFLWHFFEMRWPSVDGSHAVLPGSHQLGQLGVTDQSVPMAGYPDMPGEAWLRVQ